MVLALLVESHRLAAEYSREMDAYVWAFLMALNESDGALSVFGNGNENGGGGDESACGNAVLNAILNAFLLLVGPFFFPLFLQIQFNNLVFYIIYYYYYYFKHIFVYYNKNERDIFWLIIGKNLNFIISIMGKNKVY